MANATAALTTKIEREDTPGAGTFTTIAGLRSINRPAVQAEFEDTTDMDATSGFRTRIPTISNLGDVVAEFNEDTSDATHEQMLADSIARTVRLYRITATDGGAEVQSFNAYIESYTPGNLPVNGINIVTVTFRPTGAMTRS